MENLPVKLRDEIDALFISAYESLERKDLTKARSQAEKAWKILPEPKFDWDVTLSFVTGICEMYRELAQYDLALNIIEQLEKSDHMDEFDDGPLFLKATVYYEMKDLEQAKHWFAVANDISRGRCFVEEPAKYKEFFKHG